MSNMSQITDHTLPPEGRVSGDGAFWRQNETGFKDLMGVDPYMEGDVIDGNVKILKKTIHELPDDQKFDLIMSNHSFEHISDQLKTLSKISKICHSRIENTQW